MKPAIVCTTLLVETSPQALPLGAACIASALKAAPDIAAQFDIRLLTFSRESAECAACGTPSDRAEVTAGRLADGGAPAFACFSVYVWNRAELEETARLLKERFPHTVCIAGGPEATAAPLSFHQFDYTVSGEGEDAVPSLIRTLAALPEARRRAVPQDCLPQGVFRLDARDEAPAERFPRAVTPDIGTLPSPYLDGTLDPAQFGGALWELARGCPFRCSYCYESKGEKSVRRVPLARIEAELDFFRERAVPQIFVLDPTFNADKKRALALLSLISKKAPGTFFSFEARAEFIDRELAAAFARIPCSLQIGLQSADPAVLANIRRTFDRRQFQRNIGFLNSAGAVFGLDVIYGLPGDTFRGFKESLDFALSLYPNNLETFRLSVLPGTQLHEDAPRFSLVHEAEPPYHVISTPEFPEADMQKAEALSRACTLFYNYGRAVPWFLAAARALHERPSRFLEQFARWRALRERTERAPASDGTDAAGCSCPPHEAVEAMQLEFLSERFRENGISRLYAAARSIVRFHGALSRTEADGAMQTARLDFHPDDVAAPEASDFAFFQKHAAPFPCTVQTFRKDGAARWRIVRR